MKSKVLLALVAGVVLAGLAVRPASATPAPTTVGSIVLYQTTTFSGRVMHLTYTGCAGLANVRGQVGSYDNRPAAGCQVTLVSGAGTHALCAGRAVVPAPFRDSPLVRILPGTSLPCPLRT